MSKAANGDEGDCDKFWCKCKPFGGCWCTLADVCNRPECSKP